MEHTIGDTVKWQGQKCRVVGVNSLTRMYCLEPVEAVIEILQWVEEKELEA